MMEKNVSEPVMKRIAGFEQTRIASWWRRYTAAIIVLLCVFSLTVVFVIRQIIDNQSFDMLSVFSEDSEVIGQFWQDSVVTFWYELPKLDIFLACVVLLGILGILVATGRKREINRKKLSEIRKYQR